MGEVQWTKAQVAALERLPQEPRTGDVWQVGPHTVVVGSMEDPRVVMALLESRGSWEVCWTDPPWDLRIGATFMRQAGYEGGYVPDLGRLFKNLGVVLGSVRDLASVWTGLPAEALAREALATGGFSNAARAEVFYAGAKSATPVWVGSRGEQVNGVALAEAVAAAVSGSRSGREQAGRLVDFYAWSRLVESPVNVVDPFCGQEVAASLVAHPSVHSLSGVEVHPGRAARTLAAILRSVEKSGSARVAIESWE